MSFERKRVGTKRRVLRATLGILAWILALGVGAWWTLGRGAERDSQPERPSSAVVLPLEPKHAGDGSAIPEPTASGSVVEALVAAAAPQRDPRLEAFPQVICVGRVVDESGSGLDGATVRCIPDAWVLQALGYAEESGLGPVWWAPSGQLSAGRIELDALPAATTDAAGRFELSIPFTREPPPTNGPVARAIPELLAQRDGRVPARRVCREVAPAGFDVGDIVLQPGAIVVGRAVDDHGDGIAEVDVQASFDQHPLPVGGDEPLVHFLDPALHFRFARTGADGRFRLACLWPASADFSFDAAGRLPASRASVALSAGRELDLGDVVLEVGPAISGRVLDPTGAPLAGAEVRASIHDLDLVEIKHSIHAELDVVRWGRLVHTGTFIGEREGRYNVARTDADGRFVLGGLKQPEYGLYASAEGREPERMLHVATGSEGVELTLRPQGQLRLRLVDATTGTPVADAGLRVLRGTGDWFRDDGTSLPVRRDAAAGAEVFVIDHVCDAPMAAVVESESHGRQIITFDGLPLGAPIEERELRVPLGARLSGRVLDEGGAGLAGAEVVVHPYDYGQQHGLLARELRVLTGSDGRFEFAGLTPARWCPYAVLAGFGNERSLDLVLGPGEQRDDVTLRLLRLGSIEGLVLQAGGTPAGGVMVSAKPDATGVMAEGTSQTDADGRYALKARPGTYAVVATGPNATNASHGVTVRGGETVRVDLTLPAPARLSGRVLSNRQPVSGAAVHVSGKLLRLDALTGDDGAFSFEVPPVTGEGFAWARSPRGGLTEKRPFQSVEGRAQVVDLELGSFTFAATIVDAATGTPVAGARVSFEMHGGSGGDTLPITTDAAGRFAIHDVAPGQWLCLATHDRYLKTRWIPVEIDAGGHASVARIDMTRGGVLRGTVLTQLGGLTSREWEVGAWLDDETEFTLHTTTTKDGAWELANLEPGHYTVLLTRVLERWAEVDREDHERIAKARAEHEVAVGEDVVLDLRLEAGEN